MHVLDVDTSSTRRGLEGFHTMSIGQEVKKIQQFDWWRARGQPLGLHTSGQTPKVKGLQSTYMGVFFDTFGAKSLAPRQEFASSENGNPNSC